MSPTVQTCSDCGLVLASRFGRWVPDLVARARRVWLCHICADARRDRRPA